MVVSANRIASIAICTLNRADLLTGTLSSLADQEGADWRKIEIVVIDNNSSDRTPQAVAAFRDRLPIRYVFEPQQGIAFARNRALKECDTALTIHVDDDVELAPGWLKAYLEAFKAYPRASYFGGRIHPSFYHGRPTWLYDERLALIDGLLGFYDLGSGTRPYRDDDPLPFGANFALTRNAKKIAGGFRVEFGPRPGIPHGRGEDTDFFMRLSSAGAQGIYVGSGCAYHRTDPAAWQVNDLFQHGIQKGLTHVALHNDAITGTFLRECLFGVRGLWQLTRGRRDRFYQCVINMGIQRGLRQARHT